MLGLTVASIMFVTFATIIWRSMSSGPAQTTNQGELFPEDPSEIPDLSDLEQGARMFVTIVDRDDPTRVAGTLEADQFEPIGGGQRRLVNPDAWIYMRDGRRVHITANDGLVLMPDPNEAPDSGTLEGDVTIKSFDAPVDVMSSTLGIKSVADETPSLIAKFDEPVEFERRYQRLTSEGRFTINSPGLEFIGHDLTVMLNEVKGRVELIDVRRGERLVLRPDAQKKDVITRSEQRQSQYRVATVAYPSIAVTQDGQPAPEPKTEKKTPYHIEIQDDVLVEMIGTGTLKAEAIDIWAMLIDGSLSPNAVKEIQFAAAENATETPTAKPTQTSSAAPAEPAAANPVAPTPAAEPVPGPPSDGEVVVTWSGPLMVRPIEDPEATALSSEELAMAFTSTQRVEFEASVQGVNGSAESLRYGATSGVLELVGAADAPVEIIADQAGSLRAAMLSADLDSGLISIETPGQLESDLAADGPPARIDWGTSAEFALLKTEQGELSGRLESAYFEGQVIGTRADAVLRTDTLLAEFDDEGLMETALRTITLKNGSMNADTGSLAGDELSIGFVPMYDESGVTPVSLTATGSVLGISEDGRVETDSLDAILVREFDGQTRVRRATAVGSSSFLGERETMASGDRLEVNTDNDTVHIVGQGNEQATAGQGGSLIHGDDIWINTRSRSITVDGQGTFDHDIVTEGIATGGHLRVKWNESMRFDDALGSILCSGDVVAVSTPDAYTIDTLKADRLEIDLTPAPGTDQIDDPDALDIDGGGDREFYEARAYGRAVPGGEPVLASVESRSYDPKNPERAIGVMYLEGPVLLADNRNQTLRVPSAGMMVLMDRSEDNGQAQTEDSASVMPSTSGPGLTRMTWQGSMMFDRAGGNALVLDEVSIRHKSLTTQRVSQLGCDRLDAEFNAHGSEDQVGAIAMRRADASGNVRFTDLQRTLLSDHAIYDAVGETMFAFADDDRLVTLRDSTEPGPVSAKTLLWDLKKDLVEIDAPSPVRAPARP